MTKKLYLVTTKLLLFKKQTFTTDKWVVWYVNWYFMTTDNFSATGRLTKTRSGQMNVQKLHQQPTARFRYVGCLLHSKIWITFKIRTKRKFIHPNPTQRKRANRYVQAALNIQTHKIILMKNWWFHWLFWLRIWWNFRDCITTKFEFWKRQFYKHDATTGWRQDAMQVADICKRLFRLLDDFFEILIFRAWERKIWWQKNQTLVI